MRGATSPRYYLKSLQKNNNINLFPILYEADVSLTEITLELNFLKTYKTPAEHSPYYSAVSRVKWRVSKAKDAHLVRAIHGTLVLGHRAQQDLDAEIQVARRISYADLWFAWTAEESHLSEKKVALSLIWSKSRLLVEIM